MSERPTQTNKLLLENLDEWIDDSWRNQKPIGLTLYAARDKIFEQSNRIAELWDAMEILRCERNEAREENKKFREALEWIAERYDDSKPTHAVAMDAYEMSCTAKAALWKEEK